MSGKTIKKPAGLKDAPAGANAQGGLTTPTTTGSGYVPTIVSSSSTQGSIPSYSKSIDRPDINTTQVIANAVSQNLMGRDATPADIQKYHEAYIQYAQSHPTSSSSSMVDESGVQRNSVSVQSGVAESSFITNLMSGTAEAKDYTAATTYMDAIQKEINQARGVF